MGYTLGYTLAAYSTKILPRVKEFKGIAKRVSAS